MKPKRNGPGGPGSTRESSGGRRFGRGRENRRGRKTFLRRERRESSADAPAETQREWIPRTELGKAVKEGRISSIEEIFEKGLSIGEQEIVGRLLPNLQEDLLLIGQAKGKFGGGQRRVFRQTQKKTQEGNKIQFTTCALVGNRNGYVGIGVDRSKETVPAREKSKRRARLRLIRIRRGCGSWQCNCREPHSIPFAVTGKCGSSTITLIPAPKGKGLCVEKECAKILAFAGVKDVWSRTAGQTKTKLNLIFALLDALRILSQMKVRPADLEKLGVVEGRVPEKEAVAEEGEGVKSRGENEGDVQIEAPLAT